MGADTGIIGAGELSEAVRIKKLFIAPKENISLCVSCIKRVKDPSLRPGWIIELSICYFFSLVDFLCSHASVKNVTFIFVLPLYMDTFSYTFKLLEQIILTCFSFHPIGAEYSNIIVCCLVSGLVGLFWMET